MKIAIIDCGTNTFHLLIVSLTEKNKFTTLYKTKVAVKLGEGGITKQFISAAAFERGINTLKKFVVKIESYKPDRTVAYATAAVRQAKNGKDFINAADSIGITIQLITGKKEAELIYYGVREALHLGDELSLIMDIGGGSVEFIICNRNQLCWKHSFKSGAAYLLEKINPSDPIKGEEINKLNAYLLDKLSPLLNACRKYKPRNLVGSSGSFDTFADMISAMKHQKPLISKLSYQFQMDEYDLIHRMLLHTTLQERYHMKGLIRMRADMIVLASLLLTFVLDQTGIKQMFLSKYALKEGMLFELMSNNSE